MDVNTVSGCAGRALISGPNRKFDGYFLTISVVCLESSELKLLNFIECSTTVYLSPAHNTGYSIQISRQHEHKNTHTILVISCIYLMITLTLHHNNIVRNEFLGSYSSRKLLSHMT